MAATLPPDDASNRPTYLPMLPEAAASAWRGMLGARTDIVKEATIQEVVNVVARAPQSALPGDEAALARPVGPLLDLLNAWSGNCVFDPEAIKSPTLVLRGAMDSFADPNLASRLKRTQVNEIIIPDATHWIMYERKRIQLFNAIAVFIAS